jgi:nitrogen fixation/metabolism regulation signal transduction histidine kinase
MKPRQSYVRRLQLGLGILVGISLLGLASTIWSEQRARAALERSQDILSLLEEFKQVQILLSAARAAERDFMLEDLRTPSFFKTGTSPALEQHKMSLTELGETLTLLERDAEATDYDVASMRREIAAYQGAFEQLVSLDQERGSVYTGLLGQMREATFNVLDIVPKVWPTRQVEMRGELFELMRDQSDYLRDLDNRPRFLVSERIKILREEANTLEHAAREPLSAQIDAYDRAWQRMLQIDDQIGRSAGDGLRRRLRASEEQVVLLTTAAVERAHARFESAAGSVEQTAALARSVSAAAVILGAALAAGLALLLGRQLRESLSSVLRAVERYTAGDRRARVGRLSRDDEFAMLGESFDRMAETLAETTEELEEINASLKLAVKGDTAGLMERIKRLVAERRSRTPGPAV